MRNSVMLRAKITDIIANEESVLDYKIRSCLIDDITPLGRLYFHSYDPGEACDTEEDSIKDIKNSFSGEYGSLWLQASKICEVDSKVVGAILTVHQNSWDESVTCPYIIELFVHRDFRRKGIVTCTL